MSVNLAVPKFRVPRRLIAWMQMNGIRERIPTSEHIFLKGDPKTSAWSLVSYAKQVGRLPAEMESVIATCPASCVEYAKTIVREDVPREIIDGIKDEPALITRMAGVLSRRLVEFEDRIVTPEAYVDYASEIRTRVPEMEERILFSGAFPTRNTAMAAFRIVERLTTHTYGGFPEGSPAHDPRILELIKVCPDTVCEYMDWLSRRGLKLSPEFYGALAGDGRKLYKLAEHLRCRLPKELELTWKGGKQELVQYAQRFVRGRLPEVLEDELLGDSSSMGSYAFNVVRGLADPRLSDRLHACMVMLSFENPNDPDIKRYISECDRAAEFRRAYAAEPEGTVSLG